MAKRRFMTILDRMVFVDLIKTLTAVLAVIVVIIVSRQFMRVLDKAVEGHVANETILTILGLKIVVASDSDSRQRQLMPQQGRSSLALLI